ncbi:MAG TPA: enoyl-CoA hydratase-related protein [Chloroflexia bacterium]|nr:enoyl-CoA hydratase-related protein [Chloroflexia bacterium]
MDYQTILWAVQDGVATLTLNRPDVLNAFNKQMTDEIQDALKQAERDKAVRCLVVTGAGRAFSAGEDLKAHQGGEIQRSIADAVRTRYNPIILKMRGLEKPIIAAINGVAAGAGLSLALAADLRIMSDKAKLIEAFSRIGLVPDSGSSFFLPWLVGIGKAAELCLLAEDVPADEAWRIGLVNKVVPAGELASATAAWANKLAQGPTVAYGLTKRALNRALHAQLHEILEYEMHGQETAGRTADAQEAIAAFAEKRTPVFKGE